VIGEVPAVMQFDLDGPVTSTESDDVGRRTGTHVPAAKQIEPAFFDLSGLQIDAFAMDQDKLAAEREAYGFGGNRQDLDFSRLKPSVRLLDQGYV
jgi:hypothetical protein